MFSEYAYLNHVSILSLVFKRICDVWQSNKDDLLIFLTGIVYSMDKHQDFKLDQ